MPSRAPLLRRAHDGNALKRIQPVGDIRMVEKCVDRAHEIGQPLEIHRIACVYRCPTQTMLDHKIIAFPILQINETIIFNARLCRRVASTTHVVFGNIRTFWPDENIE